MMNPKELVAKLTTQHRGLQTDLKEAMEAAESQKEMVVEEKLIKFKGEYMLKKIDIFSRTTGINPLLL